jgi:tetratricopeptide (TPR) repeat protein/ADP-heptose:LPS heptosyltransferase
MTTPELLQSALAHHQAGRLPAAEQIYRQILQGEPNHADALHLLGVLFHQLGNEQAAVDSIGRAITLKPQSAAFHSNLGLCYQSLGRRDEAVACWRRALDLQPDLADSLSNLGNALREQGELDEALACCRRAVQVKPDFAEAHNNLGTVLRAQGKLDEAADCYRRAIELKPAFAEAHSNLGNALQAQGSLAEAVASEQRAIDLKPDYADAHLNLGGAFRDQEKLSEAADCYRRALQIQPNYAEAHLNLGSVLQSQSKLAEAVANYRRALELKPDYAEAHLNLGNALRELGNLEEAAANHRRAMELKPDSAEVMNDLAASLADQGKLDEAADYCRRALALKPDYVEAYSNLGNALAKQSSIAEALAAYRRAIELKPDYAEAYGNLGIALTKQGEFAEASAAYERALELKPDFVGARWNRALFRLLTGDFAQGWPEYEWRWKLPQAPARNFSQPLWDGGVAHGKTILLHAEQGLGDILQFIRYAPLVKLSGAKVVFECPQSLLPLVADCRGVDQLVGKGSTLPPFDAQSPLLSLPGILHTDLATIPAEVPYLFADPQLVGRWREELRSFSGFKIGIAWQGNPKYPEDKSRSFPLIHFEPLAQLEGVRLLSLQKGAGSEQLRSVVGRFSVTDLGSQLDLAGGAFMDTAAAMASLDLVITSDSAVAHLAGALGVPVWVALPRIPDWRWLLDRSDSPWYPTMRLFRQRTSGDWNGVFDEIRDALRVQIALGEKRRDELPLDLPERKTRAAQYESAEMLNDLGASLAQQGKLDEAIIQFRRALQVQPNHAETYNNLGNALAIQENLPQAVACYQRALQLKPAYASAESNLGNALAMQERWDEAVACFRRALQLEPDHVEVYENMGKAFARQRNFAEAAVAYRHAARLKPNDPLAHNRLAGVLRADGQLDEAVICHQRALQLQPDYAEAYLGLAMSWELQSKFAEALAAYQRALELKPDFVDAHWNRALCRLRLGDFAGGWPEYESRWKLPKTPARNFPQPPWDGSAAHGKTILIHAEQGLGDMLQFIRYAPLVKQCGAKVVVECSVSLLPLLADCRGVDQWVGQGTPLPPFDAHVPLLSLPGIFRTELATIPAEVPYLFADPRLVQRWREELRPISGFKIGIAWQGNPQYRGDQFRSFPLAHFEPLTRLEGVRLVSLQKGAGTEQLRDAAGRFPVTDLGSQLDQAEGAFRDTAAVMASLDLVITSDSAVAHLAGALGVPVWVVLPTVADWRWLLNRSDSPWYPSMRLFRQKTSGEWRGVFEEIRDALCVHLALGGKNHGEILVGLPDQLTPRGETADLLNDLGASLAQQGKLDEAIVQFRKALQLQPNHAETHNNLGNAYALHGDLGHAVASYQRAIQFKPDYASAASNLGNARAIQGDLAEAVACYRQALQLQPDYPEGYENLGKVLLKQGNLAEAAAAYRQALRLKPSDPRLHNVLGDVLRAHGQPGEAADCFRRCLELRPDWAEAHYNLGVALHDLGQWEQSIACYQRAMAINPGFAQAHYNLGSAYQSHWELDRAVACFERALELRPDYTDAQLNLSTALLQQGKLDEAVARFEGLIRAKPDYAEPHVGLAMARLSQGNFPQGWPEYEWRWKTKGRSLPAYDRPLWDGSPLAGRRILLYSEQGLGDTLQFVRYAPLVKQRGGRVLLLCPDPLQKILSRCPGVDEFIRGGDKITFDVHASLVSLPGILHTTLHTVPAEVPYVFADPELVQRWRERLHELPGLKIGIAWQGSTQYRWDQTRSLPLACFTALAELPGVSLVSLQKGEGTEQLAAMRERYPIVDWTAELDETAGAFMDTAALITSLDLVITSDSAVAHLAGALGAPVWLALSACADWRWMLDRNDSPWYPTMRLFRQKTLGDWTGVFQAIQEELLVRLPSPACGRGAGGERLPPSR